MPEDGHPVLGLINTDADDLAFDAYVAKPRVRQWFVFRQNFLYHYLDAETVSDALRAFFANNEGIAKASQEAG
jgi:hypothetical protein